MQSFITLFNNCRILGNITKSIVNVDEFKVHLNEEGLADKTRTDVYLHFVNEADNSILEVETVLRLIDANIESLDQLFKVFSTRFTFHYCFDITLCNIYLFFAINDWFVCLF